MAGRAAVSLFWTPDQSIDTATADPQARNTGYLAIAIGAVVVLLFTWALRCCHLYSFDNIVMSLLSVIVLVLLFSKDFRAAAFTGWRRPNLPITIMYLGSVVSFWFILSPEEYSVKGTSIYLLGGFNLFSKLDAGAFPHYGTLFVAPVFSAEPAIAAVFALFSHGSHFLYYAYGLYWLNLLVGPLIPVGAYLFFKRFISSWLSAIATVLFCLIVLDFKVWSLRGELLAWIFGFAFLNLWFDFLAGFR